MATPTKPATPGPTHRLLYRGSISLPDSYIPLDGLSFTARISDMHSTLFNNPLALTLESLRGLPLHLLETAKVSETWIEPPGDILVDIHPDATVTRLFFENLFCLTPITASSGRTEYGVRLSVTQSHDPETPDLLIYGELRDVPPTATEPVPSSSSAAPKTLHLLAAHILPGPPPALAPRLPRPDDPTPRRPPPAFGAKRKLDTAGISFDLADVAKRTRVGDKGKGKALAKESSEEAMRRAAAEVMLRMPKPGRSSSAGQVSVTVLGKDARVGAKKDVFKVPSVPVRAARAGERVAPEADVFGTVNDEPPDAPVVDGSLEKENKMAVKKAVTKALGKHGYPKTHAEFNNLYQMCYHGASFALRRRMAASIIDAPTIDRFVSAHIQMYVHDAPS
ncbi:hypothetical protein BD413DRAFT_577422 [Trametes elegans]|nr:hypothetical protein BD413DRAFT_577422 [Trametes elegans]